MAVRCGELQLIFSIGQTQKKKTPHFSKWRTNRDCKLFRMAREYEMLRTKKGAQIEDAALKERRANRDCELLRMARE